jgi:ABC-type phosphate/phosphonate transport system permease subunit
MAEKSSGSVSASLIILIIVAAVIGAVVALILQSAGLSTRAIAIISGFIATIVASIARYKILFLGAGKGPDDSRIPSLVLTYAAIASVAGSLAAHDIFRYMHEDVGIAFLGALAGLLSAILTAMLMITYHTNSRPIGS